MRIRSISESKDRSRAVTPTRMVNCEVILLDKTLLIIDQNWAEMGSSLLEAVFNKIHSNNVDKEYFGLRYLDKTGQRQWLESHRPISKQMKDVRANSSTNRFVFSLKFKHYPDNIQLELRQQITRELLYQQLKRDLLSGRLVSSQSQDPIIHLVALVCLIESTTDLESILPHVTKKIEAKVQRTLQEIKSGEELDTTQAVLQFCELAAQLDSYGVEPVPVKDQRGSALFVGITNRGIATFDGPLLTHCFAWASISKISYSQKLFMFQIVREQRKHMLGFKCQSVAAACALWKWAMDRRNFMTLEKSADAKQSKSGGGLFHRSTKYTFSGRSHKELTESCQNLEVLSDIQVSRAHSLQTLMKSGSESRFSTMPRARTKNSFGGDSSQDGRTATISSYNTQPPALPETPVSPASTGLGDISTQEEENAVADLLVQSAVRKRVLVSNHVAPSSTNDMQDASNSNGWALLSLTALLITILCLGSYTVLYLHSRTQSSLPVHTNPARASTMQTAASSTRTWMQWVWYLLFEWW